MKVIKGQNVSEATAKTKAAAAAEVKKTADAVEADNVVTVEQQPDQEDLGMIWDVLTTSLKTAKRKVLLAQRMGEQPDNFPNVLFIGGAGVGKSSQIRKWAKANGVNLFTLQGASLDAADMGGLPMITTTEVDPKTGKEKKTSRLRAQKVGTGILDQLDRPNSVLFLDELNRARPDVRAALLQLICDHIVQDFEADGGMRPFPNFLFTVAAVNPADAGDLYQTFELDQAEKGRFRNKKVYAENAVQLKYMIDKYTKEAELLDDDPEAQAECLGRLALSKAVVGNGEFEFNDDKDLEELRGDSSWNGLATTPRNLTLLMDTCDGTKKDFLSMWSDFCNSNDEATVKRILNNYKDVDNKANAPFKKATDSEYLNRRRNQSAMAAIRSRYDNEE